MSANGVESTSVTYEHLINGYCKIGDRDLVILLYKGTCRKGFRPDGKTVDAMMKLLCDNGKVSEALEILRLAMKKHTICPQRRSFEFLIKCLFHKGYMEEALKFQAEMIGRGYEPNEDIYGAFNNGYVKHGNEETAQRLRKEMLRFFVSSQNG